jgi:hypothetical protein
MDCRVYRFRKNPKGVRNGGISGPQTLLYVAAALHRFIPAELAGSVCANDLGADIVEFSRKKRARGPPRDR